MANGVKMNDRWDGELSRFFKRIPKWFSSVCYHVTLNYENIS